MIQESKQLVLHIMYYQYDNKDMWWSSGQNEGS